MSGLRIASLAYWITFAVLFVLLVISLTMVNHGKPDGIRVNYSITVYLVDENGGPVLDRYPMSTLEGVLSRVDFTNSRGYGSGEIANGTCTVFGSVWPVAQNDYMVFGASTNDSSLMGDWDQRRFNPGSAGLWTIFTYEDITRNMNDNKTATLNVTLLVSNKTGQMVTTDK